MKSAGPQNDTQRSDSIAHDEWKTARDTINTYEDHIHDLRKYGVSFITALLTAQSLLTASTTIFLDDVKLGILSVTLILLIGLRQVERVYQLRQKAIGIRATILERKLNIELTETITERSRRYHVAWRISLIYISFAAADAALGWAVLDSFYYKVALVAFSVVTSVLLASIGHQDINLTWGDRGEEGDWTMDRLLCDDGQPLKVTLTNMSPKDAVRFEAEDFAFVMRRAPTEAGDGKHPYVDPVPAQGPIYVRANMGDYTWFWPTKDKKPGIYQVFPTVGKGNFPKDAEKAKGFNELSASLGLPPFPTSESLARWVFPKALSREVMVVTPQPKP